MSRKLKFRVWNKNTNKYEYTELDYYFVIDQRIKAYIYEQYTGLKDKNGKEIYEGDIVKVNGEVALNDDICVDPIAKIVWVDSAAGFGEKFTVKKAPMVPIGLYKYEIIGDIHENPELLGGQNETNN